MNVLFRTGMKPQIVIALSIIGVVMSNMSIAESNEFNNPEIKASVAAAAAFGLRYPGIVSKNIFPFPYRIEQLSQPGEWLVTLATANTRPVTRTWWRYGLDPDLQGSWLVQELSYEEATKLVKIEILR
jgi:hypothetical protein